MFKLTCCLTLLLGFSTITLAQRIFTSTEEGFRNNSAVNIDPFVKIGNGLYYIETRSKVNWFAANDRCHLMGAELISFETIDEWNLINQYLIRNSIMDIYWTSANDLAKQGSHVWSAKGQRINLNTIWADNQPDNWKKNEHCDELGFREHPSDRRGLNDRICSDKNRYICESSHSKTVTVLVW